MEKALLPAIGVAILFVLCNVGTKKSLDEGYGWVMYLVYVVAILAFWAFRTVCKSYGLAVASGIVDSLLTIITIGIAIAVFREPLIARQWIGLGLLIVGLFLVR